MLASSSERKTALSTAPYSSCSAATPAAYGPGGLEHCSSHHFPTPPARPRIRYLWQKKNRITIGNAAMTIPANTTGY